MWPFHPLVGGHLTIQKGHLTIPKRSQKIARYLWFHFHGKNKTMKNMDVSKYRATPKSSILIGFYGFPLFSPSILGENSPYFWVDTHISSTTSTWYYLSIPFLWQETNPWQEGTQIGKCHMCVLRRKFLRKRRFFAAFFLHGIFLRRNLNNLKDLCIFTKRYKQHHNDSMNLNHWTMSYSLGKKFI